MEQLELFPGTSARNGVVQTPGELTRVVAPPRIITAPGGMGRYKIRPLPTDEEPVYRFWEDLFVNHWGEIQIGYYIWGAVHEGGTQPGRPSKCKKFDGYLTVEFDRWWWGRTIGIWLQKQDWSWLRRLGSWLRRGSSHIHLCVGPSQGLGCVRTPPEVQEHRCPKRLELWTRLNQHGQPTCWGVWMYNGQDEQMINVFLPNPLLTWKAQDLLMRELQAQLRGDRAAQQRLREERRACPPRWSDLKLWRYLRQTYRGEGPDPEDETAQLFSHD